MSTAPQYPGEFHVYGDAERLASAAAEFFVQHCGGVNQSTRPFPGCAFRWIHTPPRVRTAGHHIPGTTFFVDGGLLWSYEEQ